MPVDVGAVPGAALAKKEGKPRQTRIASPDRDKSDARYLENLSAGRWLGLELRVERADAVRGFFVPGLQLAVVS